jgi:flavin-dependent dehydrogenase
MIDTKVIIVGGGPAGSSCAWKLSQQNIPAIILEAEAFPRPKTCAGWITPKVLTDLQCEVSQYPHSIVFFRRLNYHFFGRKVAVPTRQYSIRRYEFDKWLLEKSGAAVHQHRVSRIRKEDGRYVIDERYGCEFLVGAGGTNCPVRRTLFGATNPRSEELKIIALEEEFQYDITDRGCHLWFFDDHLPGYSWYVPKGNGYLNVGIGGKYATLKRRGHSIHAHWDRLVRKLSDLALVKQRRFKPRGCSYYLREKRPKVQQDKAFIIGDAAGLATVDMGEGIGPAVQSGILAAEAIAQGQKYSIDTIGRFSLVDILLPWWKIRF